MGSVSLSLTGSDHQVSTGWIISTNQMIGPITVANLLPAFMVVVYSVMLLSCLCSTLDSVLCAASSLYAVDLLRGATTDQPSEDHGTRQVATARVGMFVTATLGLAIACIPGLQLVHLFLFYGTWRASTMIPTVLTLCWQRLNSNAVFAAILCSLIFGAPIYAAGNLFNNPFLSMSGSILVVVIGLVTCVLWSALAPNHAPLPSPPAAVETSQVPAPPGRL
jgi:Na+/proline symporter